MKPTDLERNLDGGANDLTLDDPQAKTTELGIEFDPRSKEKKLLALIRAAGK